MCEWGEGGGAVTHYISMGRDVPTKGVLFQILFGMGVHVIVKNLGRDSCITVWKGVHVWKGGG